MNRAQSNPIRHLSMIFEVDTWDPMWEQWEIPWGCCHQALSFSSRSATSWETRAPWIHPTVNFTRQIGYGLQVLYQTS